MHFRHVLQLNGTVGIILFWDQNLRLGALKQSGTMVPPTAFVWQPTSLTVGNGTADLKIQKLRILLMISLIKQLG